MDVENRIILVTGCAGNVGSIVTEKLLDMGCHVVGIDNFFTGSSDNLKYAKSKENFTFFESSILKRSLLLKLAEFKFTDVIHLARISKTEEVLKNPYLVYKTNCAGTETMFSFSKHNGVSNFIQASSVKVFGHQEEYPCKASQSVTYDSPTENNRWSFSASQLMSEYLVLSDNTDMRVIILRYDNTYGKKDLHTEKLIPYSLKQILTRKKIILPSKSNLRKRSYLHEDDAAKATLAALENGISRKIYCVSGDEEYEISSLVTYLGKLIGKKSLIGYTAYDPTDPMRRWGDTQELQEDTGWKPEIKFRIGITNLIEDAKKYYP